MSIATDHSYLLSCYQQHHRWLYAWLCRRLRCGEQAADIAQDTFERLLRKPLQEKVLEPRAFLSRIAQGLMVDQLRKRQLQEKYLQQLQLAPEAVQPSPEQQLELLQLLARIDAMLDGLKPKVRQAFLMSRLDGLGYKAIAQELGVTPSSVEKYMVTAMLHCYKMRF